MSKSFQQHQKVPIESSSIGALVPGKHFLLYIVMQECSLEALCDQENYEGREKATALEDQDVTTFCTPKGIFCYRVTPLGLKNAGATYQRAMYL